MPHPAHRLLLIGTFLPLCWLLLQVAHELGHIVAAFATGGVISKVVLHPLSISRTDVVDSSCRLMVVWAGPIVGVLLPLAILIVLYCARCKWTYLAQFFAGACLIANGAYLGVGSFARIGDAGDLIRLAAPVWHLWLFGAIAVPLGFYLWNGLGSCFGLGPHRTSVDRTAAYFSAALLALVVALEALLSSFN